MPRVCTLQAYRAQQEENKELYNRAEPHLSTQEIANCSIKLFLFLLTCLIYISDISVFIAVKQSLNPCTGLGGTTQMFNYSNK